MKQVTSSWSLFIQLGSNSRDYPPIAITSQWGGQTFLDHLKKCSYDAVEK